MYMQGRTDYEELIHNTNDMMKQLNMYYRRNKYIV